MVYHFATRLEECMSKEQAFLNPKLTLSELALRVGTNRTYLSNYINQTLHQTFFEYVNAIRLKHATQLLVSTNLTLEVIAERSGFNSLSTFRRCFIQTHNCSPSSYRKVHSR
jgi:AraC-like DNA-binding protein